MIFKLFRGILIHWMWLSSLEYMFSKDKARIRLILYSFHNIWLSKIKKINWMNECQITYELTAIGNIPEMVPQKWGEVQNKSCIENLDNIISHEASHILCAWKHMNIYRHCWQREVLTVWLWGTNKIWASVCSSSTKQDNCTYLSSLLLELEKIYLKHSASFLIIINKGFFLLIY